MSEPANDSQDFALGNPANLVTYADLDWPGARTAIPFITSAHALGANEDSVLWCCHAGEGDDDPSQSIVLPKAFFLGEDGELIDLDDAENRVVAYANNLARATWN